MNSRYRYITLILCLSGVIWFSLPQYPLTYDNSEWLWLFSLPSCDYENNLGSLVVFCLFLTRNKTLQKVLSTRKLLKT